jgi:glycosyltransferase involved in cell wall biosynthesis
MRVLFLHRNFPAQYRHVAAALASDPGNQIVFGTREGGDSLPGVTKVLFKPARAVAATTHPYVRPTEEAVLDGQAVFRVCANLRAQGFVPDLVCAHSGWGPGLYAKDVFPSARLLVYFEWYYHGRGGDADFIDPAAIDDDTACRIRTRNAPLLLDLADCDRGMCPTEFQRDQFPSVFHPKLSVLHDGIDTDYFKPAPGTRLTLPGLDLSGAAEIVTYATRGMEPYRGFPQFMRAAALLLARRPNLHIVVAGDDRVAYSRRLPEGQTYKQQLLAELRGADLSRLHFTGPLPYGEYLQLLRASSAHVYLTVPFVLSWSLLEAMATGCLVIGSDTAPVREVIEDGRTGLLADFFSPAEIAARVGDALDNRARMAPIRQAARDLIRQRYALSDLLPRHIALMREVAGL